jgi:hypothetical protein
MFSVGKCDTAPPPPPPFVILFAKALIARHSKENMYIIVSQQPCTITIIKNIYNMHIEGIKLGLKRSVLRKTEAIAVFFSHTV